MSKDVKEAQSKVVPFFARFLEEQPAETSESPEVNIPPIFTFKWPSDWEDS